MEIHSKDTPAFLYAFSNALSLRGIYIHKVMIENMGSEIRDRVYLCDTQGKRIEGKKEQELLRIATVMIKQFTHFLAWAPDPARAIRYFDQFLDKLMERGSPESVLSFLRERETLDLLARLLGTSEFLWEDFFRIQFENLLPILQDFKRGALLPEREEMRHQLKKSLARGRTLEDQKEILNRYKDREMFRIDMKHLLEPPDDLMDFSWTLTDLTEVVLDQAHGICHRRLTKRYGLPLREDQTVCPFAVCGLGKFGGREMGYASDIEALFVYGGPGRTGGKESIENGVYFERLCQEILNCIEAKREGIFRIDLRLRPYGSAGALANPIDQLRRYYSPQGEAAPFERQALTKLRWVAGDASLGREMETHRDLFVYSEQPWDLGTALHLRLRQINELVKPGGVNVKFSPGGVIDIEYAVQYLQVMYGGRHRELRTTSTLEALEGLCRVRIISQKEWNQLREAYLFLRVLIDGLRIVRGNASDLVLPDQGSDEMRFLARRLGYSGSDWERGARKLVDAIHRQMANAHHFFVSRFERV
jgi:glutamate-ammonia-ligase adenylyltransferase